MRNIEATMSKILTVLAADGKDGITSGQLAKRVGITRGWCWKVLERMVKSGDIYKCELPHGYHYQFTKTLYFTVNRMMEMNGGKLPSPGKVYVIKQKVITEVVGSNGDKLKAFTA